MKIPVAISRFLLLATFIFNTVVNFVMTKWLFMILYLFMTVMLALACLKNWRLFKDDDGLWDVILNIFGFVAFSAISMMELIQDSDWQLVLTAMGFLTFAHSLLLVMVSASKKKERA